MTETKNRVRVPAPESGNDRQVNDERAEPAREELEEEAEHGLLDSFYDACEKANRVKFKDWSFRA
jgi:hypothetical protein